MKHIILCADDYGQNAVISQAIVELLQAKRLSATSCIVTGKSWPEAAAALKPFKGRADIGLHFNLTQGTPLSTMLPAFLSLKELIIQAALRKLDKAAIAAELRAQFDHFVATMGQLPDFLDGHHHIHQLPLIRDVIFTLYQEKMAAQQGYMRCTYDPKALFRFKDVAYLKQLFIQLCGAIVFKHNIVKHKIPHNTSFAGIYNFSESYEYADLFPRFLAQIGDGGIIMCHPALMDNKENDEIKESRHNEYLYFSGNQFVDVCADSQIMLSRFKDLKPLAK